MQITNRLFPYPIYSSDVDDYKKNKFNVEIVDGVHEKEENIVFNIKIEIDNPKIVELINNGNIDIAVHVECAKTSYRNLIVIGNRFLYTVSISSKSINGSIDVCCFLVAAKSLEINNSYGINAHYNNSVFNVDKGYILGYYNLDRIIVDKDIDELLKPSSIFSVVKKLDAQLPLDVELDNSTKIKIILDENTYNQFVPLQNERCLPVLHSIIVLPALIYTIERLQDKSSFDTYNDKKWFMAIDQQLKLLNINIENGDLCNKTSVVIAQELLKLPVNKSLQFLTDMEVE